MYTKFNLNPESKEKDSLREILSQIKEINDPANDSPFKIKIVGQHDFLGSNRTLNLMVMFYPHETSIFYYVGYPTRVAQVQSIVLPWMNLSFQLSIRPNSYEAHGGYIAYSAEELTGTTTFDLLAPFLGNHNVFTVCMGTAQDYPNLTGDLKGAISAFYQSYIFSTFNHSTSPYLSHAVIQHLYMMNTNTPADTTIKDLGYTPYSAGSMYGNPPNTALVRAAYETTTQQGFSWARYPNLLRYYSTALFEEHCGEQGGQRFLFQNYDIKTVGQYREYIDEGYAGLYSVEIDDSDGTGLYKLRAFDNYATIKSFGFLTFEETSELIDQILQSQRPVNTDTFREFTNKPLDKKTKELIEYSRMKTPKLRKAIQ